MPIVARHQAVEDGASEGLARLGRNTECDAPHCATAADLAKLHPLRGL